MASLTTGMAEQYDDSRRLAARARLHADYTISGEPWFPWVASRLPIDAGDRLLDVGCGPGWFWTAAAPTLPIGLDLTLSDVSASMVAEAETRCGALPFAVVKGQIADAGALPFDDQSVDGVIAMHMLYHLPEPARAVAEMYRVLKPGGFVAVTTNGMDNMRGLYELTTVMGGVPYDPAAAAFGFAEAECVLRDRFGNVASHVNPGLMRITSAEDVFLALTSYPPGDRADRDQLAALKSAIDAAFAKGGGALHVKKESGLFLARKA